MKRCPIIGGITCRTFGEKIIVALYYPDGRQYFKDLADPNNKKDIERLKHNLKMKGVEL